MNHRLDYLHDPENAPFLLSENKDSVWYKIPKEDGGEELKMVKMKKQSISEEKPKFIKIKRFVLNALTFNCSNLKRLLLSLDG